MKILCEANAKGCTKFGFSEDDNKKPYDKLKDKIAIGISLLNDSWLDVSFKKKSMHK